tara:strand:+ start:1472 stop:1843 length:372 start_codon:yes stop_codon:yes gene_type:complete
MNIREIIREEIEMPDGVNVVSVIYFPSHNAVLNKGEYMTYDEEGPELNQFDHKNVNDILRNGFIGDGERILIEIKDWIEEFVDNMGGEDGEYYQKLLDEITLRTFVIRAEEVPRTDSSFFDKF